MCVPVCAQGFFQGPVSNAFSPQLAAQRTQALARIAFQLNLPFMFYWQVRMCLAICPHHSMAEQLSAVNRRAHSLTRCLDYSLPPAHTQPGHIKMAEKAVSAA